MGDLLAIEFEIPDYLKRVKTQFKRIQIAIAADMQTNVGLRFDNEGAYNGHPKWQDLKSGANIRRTKNGLQERQILRKSGALKNSIVPSAPTGQAGANGYVKLEGDIKNSVVTIGTSVKYAAIHDKGGVISHPGTSNGFGRGIKIPAHAIPIPKRNFSERNSNDNKETGKMLKNLLQEILNGR